MLEQERREVVASRIDSHDGPLHVDFLYWEECPSHERALQLLHEVMRDEGIEANIYQQRVDTDEEAEALRFPGSPTIRINGVDIDDDPGLPIGLTCRVYRTANGRMSPLPSRDLIANALRTATHAPEIEGSPLAPCGAGSNS